MDLYSLSTFVKVVQTGSFTKAAASIGTHKARVSRGLAGLEKELGVRLLERTTRRVRLTEVGQQIYDQAVGVLAAVDDIQSIAGNLQSDPQGTLRLMVTSELGVTGFGRWIDAYAEKYPKVAIEIDVSDRPVDLVAEGLDLALHTGPLAESAVGARKVGELSYGLYASPAYLERHGTPQDGDDLRKHPLLMFSGSGQRGWRLVTLSRELRIDGPARVRANDSLVVRDAAMRGLGIALLPTVIGKEEVSRGTLRRVLSAWSAPKVPVHALFLGGRDLVPKVRAFIDLASTMPLS
ncbi:MAG TPA: LysR family transcriptional regulator [Steroidobacteraceae bacterium]